MDFLTPYTHAVPTHRCVGCENILAVTCSSTHKDFLMPYMHTVLTRSVLQCVAVCCSVLLRNVRNAVHSYGADAQIASLCVVWARKVTT